MKTLRIVQVDCGKFAVQKRDGWLNDWEWMERNKNTNWHAPSNILSLCLMDTVKDAEDSLERILAEITEAKPPRVVKVIRKVKV